MPTTSRLQNLLFVEGNNDVYAIVQTLLKLRPSWPREPKEWFGEFEVKDCKNDQSAIDSFRLAAKDRGRYGLVLDADDVAGKRVQERWDAISVLINPVIGPDQMPSTPSKDGWTFSAPGKSLGVWLMPDNQNTGAIEALLTSFVPQNDRLWGYADTIITDIQRNYSPVFPSQYASKARLHTWLAWRKEPGRPYGRAISSGDLDPTGNAVADAFAVWFEQLFGPT